ncbi:pre-mRNA-splicing factor SYF1, partial [Tanacetum coccineum]
MYLTTLTQQKLVTRTRRAFDRALRALPVTQHDKIFEGNPTKQILTYTEAVRTIDPMKAVGKPHTLWVAFAKFYETCKDVANARVILDKAVQ